MLFLTPLLLFFATTAFATSLLPYSIRTRAYSGFGTTIRGDNENIGMAGATVAIPDSVSSIETNPAGLTMTMGSVTAQINSNEMEDRSVTGAGQKKITSSQWGLTVTPGDWGYAIGYYTPNFEGGSYVSANTAQEKEYEVSLKQFRFSVSHSLMDKRLSIGASLEINHAVRKLGPEDYGATDLTFALGMIYHIQNHFLVGANYSPPQEIGGAILGSGTPDLPGFAQPVRSPMLLNVGAGWIPNRFFSAGFSILTVGSTKDTALLRDQNLTVGEGFTLQPRLGVSYVIGQFEALKISAAAGTYYETSRTAGESNRLHGTGAFQVNPWFVNLGVGVDRATNYNNFFISIGFDLVRGVRTAHIIPKDSVPPLNGFWPKPLVLSADGLPDALTAGERKRFWSPSAMDVTKIIENIPTNIENIFNGNAPVPEEVHPPDPERKARVNKKKRKLGNGQLRSDEP